MPNRGLVLSLGESTVKPSKVNLLAGLNVSQAGEYPYLIAINLGIHVFAVLLCLSFLDWV